tara:strand:- start:56 stop:439 length:384 start_codon:yes stop_codon:yes gene_type:complete
MRLIENYVELFHNYSLPSPEKCFILEKGDELYINKWIKKGKINGKMREIFEWIEEKYLTDKELLKKTDEKKFNEIHKRFYMKNWRIILLMSNYQSKYRYYSKAINSIKDKSFSDMNNDDFLNLFKSK